MNTMAEQAASAPKKSRVVKSAIGATAVLAAAAGAWFVIDSQERRVSCDELAGSNEMRSALGAEGASASTCEELGEAIKGATIGTAPGRHSEQQAQAMKNVLLALGDATQAKTVERGLHVPLSEALADYATDTRAMLASGRADYVRRSGRSEKPWKDADGVHFAIHDKSLLRVLRVVSEDPTAYATLRGAATRQAARELAAVPHDATDPNNADLTAPSTGNARALAAFDAIAADLGGTQGDDEGDKWAAEVFASLTHGADTSPPAFDGDPAGYVTATWIKRWEKAGATKPMAMLRNQGPELTEIWATARGLDPNTVAALRKRADRSSQTGFNDARRTLN
ncbi:hypothetical protein HHL19_32600 [Streptomyces sp. R302]|uniref:hypothetical protein n=1 Tax=unclassified Streptomyces TaxID=2593676 RepID=UPI00145D2507|nr:MULTISPECIES: hypothetical protein [unclassified Streptomyces]NML53999.1 hypothetical protein [Streptomyces sp. R301]NML83259.1 hypothetical protein [Streptomyces sp. R302]